MSNYGKFSSKLSEAIYMLALDGEDDLKTYHDGASVSLVLNIVPPDAPFSDWTPVRMEGFKDSEVREARMLRAAVVHECSDGIVRVYMFKTNENALAHFARFEDPETEDPEDEDPEDDEKEGEENATEMD
jgi:hypothetical protein